MGYCSERQENLSLRHGTSPCSAARDKFWYEEAKKWKAGEVYIGVWREEPKVNYYALERERERVTPTFLSTNSQSFSWNCILFLV